MRSAEGRIVASSSLPACVSRTEYDRASPLTRRRRKSPRRVSRWTNSAVLDLSIPVACVIAT